MHNATDGSGEHVAAGILDPDRVMGGTAAVDTRTRVALRSGVTVLREGCAAEHVALCAAPTVKLGLDAAGVSLQGDFGRATAPRIVEFVVDDPARRPRSTTPDSSPSRTATPPSAGQRRRHLRHR